LLVERKDRLSLEIPGYLPRGGHLQLIRTERDGLFIFWISGKTKMLLEKSIHRFTVFKRGGMGSIILHHGEITRLIIGLVDSPYFIKGLPSPLNIKDIPG